jgi:hypothetical protein
MIPNRISHTSVQSSAHEFQKRNISSFQGNVSSIQNYQGLSFLPVTFTGLANLFPQQLCGNLNYQHWWSSGKILASGARGPEFKFSVLCLLLFHDDILWSLGLNLAFMIPFGIM